MPRRFPMLFRLVHLLLFFSLPSIPSLVHAQGQNATKPGRFHIEHPTLLNLGFEWPIEGDANRNASVTVRFRRVGEGNWRDALPLLRIGGENIYRRKENLDYTVPHGFAGSILNLQPDTAYECQFTLSDPDGVSGEATKTVTVKTRGEPKPYRAGRTLHVYPPDYFGPREQPASFRPITALALATGPLFGNAAFSRATRSFSTADSTNPNAATTLTR